MKVLALSILIFLELVWIARTYDGPDWTYDIVEINTINNTPDLFENQIYLKRIARGRFVVDGTIAIKEDLTDDTMIYAEFFFSLLGSHFVRTPFELPHMPLSTFLNGFYKDVYLDPLKECATNVPLNDGSETFVPPLTKRVMVLENCTFPNDNMPSHLRPGFYKAHFYFTNQVKSTLIVLIQVESK